METPFSAYYRRGGRLAGFGNLVPGHAQGTRSQSLPHLRLDIHDMASLSLCSLTNVLIFTTDLPIPNYSSSSILQWLQT
jgi:hypothetical protein